jgi:broad-specificity NMP kinase
MPSFPNGKEDHRVELIFLYGAPGVGKLTVANAIATVNGYKVFHNHLTVDLAHALFEFGSDDFTRLTEKVRLEMLEEAAKANLPGVIFTFVYASGEDNEFIQRVMDTLAPYGVTIKFVLLTCDTDILLHRVTDETRSKFGKIRNPEFLKTLLCGRQFDRVVPHAPSLVIDTTNVSPTDAAAQIVTWSVSP